MEIIAEQNMKKIVQFTTGSLKKEIIKMMGPPEKEQSCFVNGTGIVEFIFYRTGASGQKLEEDFTPFAFKEDQLLAWGWPFYRMIQVAKNSNNSVISNLSIDYSKE